MRFQHFTVNSSFFDFYFCFKRICNATGEKRVGKRAASRWLRHGTGDVDFIYIYIYIYIYISLFYCQRKRKETARRTPPNAHHGVESGRERERECETEEEEEDVERKRFHVEIAIHNIALKDEGWEVYSKKSQYIHTINNNNNDSNPHTKRLLCATCSLGCVAVTAFSLFRFHTCVRHVSPVHLAERPLTLVCTWFLLPIRHLSLSLFFFFFFILVLGAPVECTSLWGDLLLLWIRNNQKKTFSRQESVVLLFLFLLIIDAPECERISSITSYQCKEKKSSTSKSRCPPTEKRGTRALLIHTSILSSSLYSFCCCAALYLYLMVLGSSDTDAGVERKRSREAHITSNVAEENTMTNRTRDSLPCRITSEWTHLEDGGLLLLEPTTEMVRRCHRVVQATRTKSTAGAAESQRTDPSLDSHESRRITAHVSIAAFDLDDTLIVPRNGKVFCSLADPSDWRWVAPVVPQRLRRLHQAGYLLVLYSNQAGASSGGRGAGVNPTAVSTLEAKICNLSAALGLPLAAAVSTGKNRWRKPNPSMWELMVAIIRREVAALHPGATEVVVECSRSFYCGDAAGRTLGPTLAGRAKDHACTDRKFAYNIGGGLHFLVPEAVFGPAVGEEQLIRGTTPPTLNLEALAASTVCMPFSWDGVDPAALRTWPRHYESLTLHGFLFPDGRETSLSLQGSRREDPGQELVLLVGLPGCGKTTFYRRFFAPLGYAHINRDTLGTKAKCLKAAAAAWSEGKSVVIDNTNPTSAGRREYINLVAEAMKRRGSPSSSSGHANDVTDTTALPVRVFLFTHTVEEAMHLNAVRAQAGLLSSTIPKVAYLTFRKQYEPYTAAVLVAERVKAVYEVPPVACFEGLPPTVEESFYRLY
eukprot:gene11606-7995_t